MIMVLRAKRLVEASLVIYVHNWELDPKIPWVLVKGEKQNGSDLLRRF